ncbi:MAG: hypothetical protein V2A73_23040 [Pseudomonadota bacterium]
MKQWLSAYRRQYRYGHRSRLARARFLGWDRVLLFTIVALTSISTPVPSAAVSVSASATAVLAASPPESAAPEPPQPSERFTVPSGASEEKEAQQVIEADVDVDVEEEFTAGDGLAARLGVQLSLGDLTPGGLRVGALFLHRMTMRSWFDGEMAFTFGGDEPGCPRPSEVDPGEKLVCDHGVADGFAFQLFGGGRLGLLGSAGHGSDRAQAYLRAGIGLHLARFAGDDLTGVAMPIWGGAGGMMPVATGVRLVGELLFFGGPAFYDRALGFEPYAGFLAQLGVEIAL